MLYKLINDCRNYSNYKFYNVKELTDVSLPINPILEKLFHDDIFVIDDKIVKIHTSNIRKNKYLSGLLIIDDNKTYGIYNKKKMYKCIPDDFRLPIFLIPYEFKKIGFSKKYTNLYITFEFFEWSTKHPIGKITQNLGNVDYLNNFYEYQLYCKNLNHSILSLNTKTITNLNIKNKKNTNHIDEIVQEYNIFDIRTISQGWYAFSIDPNNCTDFDDAFSIKHLDNGNILISIYISNVPIWIDYLELWDYLSKRVSTLYLPDKKRPMLPSILSDNLCSLKQNEKRIVLALDLTIENNSIIQHTFSNVVIEISKNFIYEETELLENLHYNTLKSHLCLLQNNKNKFYFLKSICDSHDIVANLMIIMNYYCAENLKTFNTGIFRTTFNSKNQNPIPSNCPSELSSFLLYWQNISGLYLPIEQTYNSEYLKHSVLKLDCYVHITSPIRRLVDILNQIQFSLHNKLIKFSKQASNFYLYWEQNIEFINTSMKSIRKIQTDCALLDLVNTEPSILEKNYSGYCVDIIEMSNSLFQYIIYIPKLSLTGRIIHSEKLSMYFEYKFSLYLFKNENTFKKKIRIQIEI
jgi:exoribonuclease R